MHSEQIVKTKRQFTATVLAFALQWMFAVEIYCTATAPLKGVAAVAVAQ